MDHLRILGFEPSSVMNFNKKNDVRCQNQLKQMGMFKKTQKLHILFCYLYVSKQPK